MPSRTRFMIQAALIAAFYAALTILLQPISYGPIQFRISEVLTILPAVMPASIPGLFVGCLLANYMGGFGLIDTVLGSLATLLAAFATFGLRKQKFLFPLPPAIFNGLIVGAYVYFLYDKTYPLLATMGFIALSEVIICYALGLPLISLIKKNQTLRHSLRLSDD